MNHITRSKRYGNSRVLRRYSLTARRSDNSEPRLSPGLGLCGFCDLVRKVQSRRVYPHAKPELS